jgi:hypothetical protein
MKQHGIPAKDAVFSIQLLTSIQFAGMYFFESGAILEPFSFPPMPPAIFFAWGFS